jgi:hypothetical protein
LRRFRAESGGNPPYTGIVWEPSVHGDRFTFNNSTTSIMEETS